MITQLEDISLEEVFLNSSLANFFMLISSKSGLINRNLPLEMISTNTVESLSLLSVMVIGMGFKDVPCYLMIICDT